MRRGVSEIILTSAMSAILLALVVSENRGTHAYAKDKIQRADADDATYRLFQLLDASQGGKLADFCILAEIYKNKDGQEFQHVLRVDYDKNRAFGKLKLSVRGVAKLAPEQLQAYSSKQIYEFGETDLEKFVKTEAGPFGRPGDIYLRAGEDSPLAESPITDDVRGSYEFFVTQYVLPALQKK